MSLIAHAPEFACMCIKRASGYIQTLFVGFLINIFIAEIFFKSVLFKLFALLDANTIIFYSLV